MRADTDLPRVLPTPWLAGSLLLLGIAGFTALWITLGFYNTRQNSWMAVIGAFDIAWMLRLGGWRAGAPRALAGVASTALIVLLANWGITSAQLGRELGLEPWDAALKLGSHHAWTLAQLANGFGDVLWIALALVAAAITSR